MPPRLRLGAVFPGWIGGGPPRGFSPRGPTSFLGPRRSFANHSLPLRESNPVVQAATRRGVRPYFLITPRFPCGARRLASSATHVRSACPLASAPRWFFGRYFLLLGGRTCTQSWREIRASAAFAFISGLVPNLHCMKTR